MVVGCFYSKQESLKIIFLNNFSSNLLYIFLNNDDDDDDVNG